MKKNKYILVLVLISILSTGCDNNLLNRLVKKNNKNINYKEDVNLKLLKDVTESSMIDAVDKNSYKNGTMYMNSDKFVENFLRKFAESSTLSHAYIIKIYEIDENKPEVILLVKNIDDEIEQKVTFSISDRLDSLLETPY